MTSATTVSAAAPPTTTAATNLVPGQALDDQRWSAMIAKSFGAVGATARIDPFVIAVRTTGIYCRVGCPARTPYRQNVQFFDTTAQAADAGFRACKRCHPDEGDLAPWQPKSTRTPRTDQRSEQRTGTLTAT